MATLTRSKVRQDKDGSLIRFYVVLSLDYWAMIKLARAVDGAGFKRYRRTREYKGPKAGRMYAALWKVPAHPLYEILIRDAYQARAHERKVFDYRQDFLRQLGEMEAGKIPTKRAYIRTHAID